MKRRRRKREVAVRGRDALPLLLLGVGGVGPRGDRRGGRTARRVNARGALPLLRRPQGGEEAHEVEATMRMLAPLCKGYVGFGEESFFRENKESYLSRLLLRKSKDVALSRESQII